MNAALLAVNPTSGSSLLSSFGALAVLVVTFMESGLLVVGFFVPGDTLLFPAGVFCATEVTKGPQLTLWQVLLCAAVGSLARTQFSYYLGRRGGQAALAQMKSRKLKAVLARSEEMLSRYGYRKAIVISRFVPMVRSVLGPAAGMLQVPVRTFTLWQVVGGLAWTQSLVLAGFWLGAAVPGVENYLLPLVGTVVLVSMLPALLQRRRPRPQSGPQGPSDPAPDRTGADTPGADTPGADTPGADTPGADTPPTEQPGPGDARR